MADALREAVKCFRNELYLAAVVMLGAASEAAWMRLADSLTERVSPTERAQLLNVISSPNASAAKVIGTVVKVIDRPEMKPILAAAEVRQADLKAVSVWADVVRDARNAIHLGVRPAMQNSYEKVAALLIGAVPHLRCLYRLYAAQPAQARRDGRINNHVGA